MKIGIFRRSDQQLLVSLYCRCFAEPPWHELFTTDEVQEMFDQMNSWSETSFLVVREDEKPVGAIIGFNLSRKPDVQLLIDPDKQISTFYLAELFIQSNKRRHGLGHKLVDHLINEAKGKGYAHVALRTSVSPWLVELYTKLGFKIVGEQQVTTTKKIDGREIKLPDDRVIMINDLSQK